MPCVRGGVIAEPFQSRPASPRMLTDNDGGYRAPPLSELSLACGLGPSPFAVVSTADEGTLLTVHAYDCAYRNPKALFLL